MEQWLSSPLQSYSLRDFLIFSPEAYFKLYELSNLALWPLHIVLGLFALIILYLIHRRHRFIHKILFVWLAIIWLFIGLWFLRGFYSQINTLANPLSYLFFCEAMLFALLGLVNSKPVIQTSQVSLRSMSGWVVILYAYFVHPLAAIFWERSVTSVEIFSIAPDPTSIGTIGFLLLLKPKGFVLLMIIPCIWLVLSIMTYMAF